MKCCLVLSADCWLEVPNPANTVSVVNKMHHKVDQEFKK